MPNRPSRQTYRELKYWDCPNKMNRFLNLWAANSVNFYHLLKRNFFMYKGRWETCQRNIEPQLQSLYNLKKGTTFCCNRAIQSGLHNIVGVLRLNHRCWMLKASGMNSRDRPVADVFYWFGSGWGDVGDPGGATANCIVLPFRWRMIATSVGSSIASSWFIKINWD